MMVGIKRLGKKDQIKFSRNKCNPHIQDNACRALVRKCLANLIFVLQLFLFMSVSLDQTPKLWWKLRV